MKDEVVDWEKCFPNMIRLLSKAPFYKNALAKAKTKAERDRISLVAVYAYSLGSMDGAGLISEEDLKVGT